MNCSERKINLKYVLIAIAVIFAAFAIASAVSLSYGGSVAEKSVFAGENDITFLPVKAKVSADGKYLLLVTGFDPSALDEEGLYYMGYKFAKGGSAVDTARDGLTKPSTYYGSIYYVKDEEFVFAYPETIYGSSEYQGYGLLVYEIPFVNDFKTDIASYSGIRAYIDKVVSDGNGGYETVSASSTEATNVGENFVYNSGFELNSLSGWSRNTDISADGKEFGGIDNASTFWGEGYAMNNDGYYFSSYAWDSSEASTGTLVSPSFKIGGSGYISFMLGGAGNPACYITVEDLSGNVLAIYRNTEFADFPAGDFSLDDRRAMIGNTVFLANFVKYKADLSDYIGRTVTLTVHDEATAAWGVVFFDELVTYYSDANSIIGAVEAENQLADKAALASAIEGALSEQGDYTSDSYALYVSALASANDVNDYLASTQAQVDDALTALTAATQALTLRLPEQLTAETNYRVDNGAETEIDIADHVDENELTKIAYEVVSADGTVATVSEIADGKFTVTAVGYGETTVSLLVKYDGTTKLTIVFNFTVSSEPTVISESVSRDIDVYAETNKTDVTLDFKTNVYNPASLALTYSATMKIGSGEASAIALTDGCYTFAYGTYNDQATVVTFSVTVEYTALGVDGSIEYDYVLNLTDSTAYQMANGGFETGDLTGWSISNAQIGDVSSATNYWLGDGEQAEGYAFGMVGDYMFSAYATNVEPARGVLTSPTFTIGGARYITYLLGAAKNGGSVYIDVVEASTGNILGRYSNDRWAERTDGKKSGCTLIPYRIGFAAENAGKTAYLRIVDDATNDYGLFFIDDVKTYYTAAPDGYYDAALISGSNIPTNIYQVVNGSFETGDTTGWFKSDEDFIRISAQEFYWKDANRSYNRSGNYLVSGVEDEKQPNLEGARGTLSSSLFTIGGSGWITFKIGGGGHDGCYVLIIDYVNGEVLAKFHNQQLDEARMKVHAANLSAYIGRTVYIRIVDDATWSWGCMALDDFITYYASAPTVYDCLARDIKNDLINGGFEYDLYGWTHSGDTFAHITEFSKWFDNQPYNKVGTRLYTGLEDCNDDGWKQGNGNEGGQGELRSNDFVLGGCGYISFLLAGGNNDCYIEIYDVTKDRSLGQFVSNGYEVQGYMSRYYVDLHDYVGDTMYIYIVDHASSGWGCIAVDDFITYYESAPAEGTTARARA